MSIRKDSPIPLYVQIAEAIGDRIDSGDLQPGEALPTQRDLMRQFGVSRVTVRQAVSLLGKDGLVTSKQGKGTFVSRPVVQQRLVTLQSLTEVMREGGLQPEVRVLEFERRPPPAEVALQLEMPEGNPALYVRRLHLYAGAPIGLALIYIPDKFSRGWSLADVERVSIYSLLEAQGVIVGQGVQVMRAQAAEPPVARLLHVGRGGPILFAQRVTSSTESVPVEHITFYYRADLYQFQVRLRRAAEASMWPSDAEDGRAPEGGGGGGPGHGPA